MYVQGEDSESTQHWVDLVHNLRYKDYQLSAPVMATKANEVWISDRGSLEEVTTVKEMAARMEGAGLHEWWRKAMGFSKE